MSSDASKIEGRRQRAREAYADGAEYVETATRVKITDGAEEAACNAYGDLQITESMRAAIEAALTELGFEMES